MTNEIEKVETNLPAIPEGCFGTENITGEDIFLSKLLVMQPLSKMVVAGNAASGDIIDSVSAEVLGKGLNHKGESMPVEVCVLFMNKSWVIEALNGQRWNYKRQEPYTPENMHLDPMAAFLEKDREGKEVTCRRNLCMNYHLLPAKQLDQPDVFPMAVSFRRTSFFTGKILANYLTKLKLAKMSAFAKTFNLCAKLEKNDDGSFWVWTVSPGRITTDAERLKAYNWYETLQKSSVKVDDSDMEKVDEVSQPKADTVAF